MTRLISLLILTGLMAGCSLFSGLDKVVPDRRTEYEKSKAMPNLEIPPDLTADASNTSMSIPGEGASLSQYQRARAQRNQAPAPTTAAAAPEGLSNQQWVSVNGSRETIWPKLETFFKNKGYSLDLNDVDLGVMETNWSKPEGSDADVYRDKYRIVTDAGATPGVTVLFITNQRQVQAGQGENGAEWLDQGKSIEAEKLLSGELNVYLNGNSSAGRTAESGQNNPAADNTGESDQDNPAAGDTGESDQDNPAADNTEGSGQNNPDAPKKQAELQNTGEN